MFAMTVKECCRQLTMLLRSKNVMQHVWFKNRRHLQQPSIIKRNNSHEAATSQMLHISKDVPNEQLENFDILSDFFSNDIGERRFNDCGYLRLRSQVGCTHSV